MNIKKFLKSNNVYYITEGPNVKKGNINIKCLWCLDDPSEHLGINLKYNSYSCWRNDSHRDNNIVKLIQKLLNCSWQEAKQIAYQKVTIDLEDMSLTSRIKNILKPNHVVKIKKSVNKLVLLDDFKKVVDTGIRKRFWDYLVDVRGFVDESRLLKLIEINNIHCCLVDDWKYRLIFPITQGKKLMTWSSRIIMNSSIPYIDLSPEKSVIGCKQLLYDYDRLSNIKNGNILYVVEGIFDVFKLQYFDFFATCIFTKTIRDNQIFLLRQLLDNFKEIRVLLDGDAYIQAIKIVRELRLFGKVTIQRMPKGVGDPGEFDEKSILKL